MKKRALLMLFCAGLSALSLFCLTGCDSGSSGGTADGSSYDYYDSKGNGYNDEDVDWSGKDKSGNKKDWADAVNDWNSANGY